MTSKRWQKREGKNKKLLLPLMRNQPINKVTQGHWAFSYVQLDPR